MLFGWRGEAEGEQGRVGKDGAKVAAVSLTQPTVAVVVVAAGADVTDADIKTAMGSGWEVTSLIKSAESMGLPLRGEIAFRFLRRAGHADPAQLLGTFQAAAVVPMANLLKSMDAYLEEGLRLLWAKTTQPPEPEDLKSVIAEVAKNGHLPGHEADLVPYSFPFLLWAELSAAHKRRAVVLLAWAVRSAAGESACCDLDAVRGPIYLGGALPDTHGLKMFLKLSERRSLAVQTFTPNHVLAARGYMQPGRINLSTLGLKKAHRAVEAAMPAPMATASILAAMRAKSMGV